VPAETAEIPTRLTGSAPRDSARAPDPGVPSADTVGADKARRASQSPKTEYIATVYPSPQTALPDDFCQAIKHAEAELKMPIWVLIQNHDDPYPHIDEKVVRASRQVRADLRKNQKVGLLIGSPGGDARSAYQTAMVFRKHCREVTAIVPGSAKSAATLLALSADEIVLGTDGELGPLDAQLFDPDREELLSALDEFQALERLHAFALEAFDRSMLMLVSRTGKKTDTLMPLVSRFVTDMVRPLFEKIDAVHYTQMARALKVAEDYAVRLLQPRYPVKEAQRIARHLVEKYSEHGFVIDAKEAQSIGLKVAELSVDQIVAVDALTPMLDHGLTVLGCLKEKTNP
jgi:hypothetical protein